MFSTGDQVIHFAHGAGVIIEKKEMQITDTPHCYLVIQMLGSKSTLMVTTDRAKECLRPVSERAMLRRLLTSELADEPGELPQDYKQRIKHVENKLKSGETKEWIGVVRDLTCREEQGPLSSSDRRLLDRAIDLLSGELSLAYGLPQEEAMSHLKPMVQRRHKLADDQGARLKWWQVLGEKVKEPFAKSNTDTG